MGSAAAWAVPLVLGGLGLAQNAQAQKKSQSLQEKALKAGKPVEAAQTAAYQEAANYDPARQDRLAFQTATKEANTVLDRAISDLNRKYNGAPGNDTQFSVDSTNNSNRVLDPLREWMSNQIATQPLRKLQALESVFSAPSGQLSNNYFNAANMTSPSASSWSSSLGMFADALSKAPWFKKPAEGSGYSGAGTPKTPIWGQPGHEPWQLPVSYGGFGS